MEIPLTANVRGNLLVVVHHVRAIPVAKKAGIVRSLCMDIQLHGIYNSLIIIVILKSSGDSIVNVHV